MEGSKSEFEEPPFFSLLPLEDQAGYIQLRESLNSYKKYKRYKRLESLSDQLDEVRRFCMRNDGEDWRRYLVCGICWMGYDLAINIRQLKDLVGKCKSSINGALLKMGYGTIPIKSIITEKLLEYIPFLKGNYVEQRQWTIRRKFNYSPVPEYYTNQQEFSNNVSESTPQPPTPNENEYEDFPFDESPASEFFNAIGLEKENRPPKFTYSNEETTEGRSSMVVESTQPIEDQLFEFDDAKFNFIADPCCCCPVDWVNSFNDIDEYFTFA